MWSWSIGWVRGEGYGALLIMQLDCSDAHDEHGAGGVWTDVFCNNPIPENIYMLNCHRSGSIEGGQRRSLLPAIDFGQSGVTDVPDRSRPAGLPSDHYDSFPYSCLCS